MRVITLDNRAFEDACTLLGNKVRESFVPDVVVGIATGGERVGRIIFSHLQKENPSMIYVEASASRPVNSAKKRKILSLFPRIFLDIMRKFEARWLSVFPGSKERNFSMNPSKTALDVLVYSCRVLIVDDALDSGATMRSAYEYISAKFPGCELKTAVLTITTPSPDIKADYFLYNNCVLIRFPWSNDMKQ